MVFEHDFNIIFPVFRNYFQAFKFPFFQTGFNNRVPWGMQSEMNIPVHSARQETT